MKRIENAIITLRRWEDRVKACEEHPSLQIKTKEVEQLRQDLENYIMTQIVIKNQKFNLYNLIEFDGARSYTKGIFHYEGFKYATDAHVLFKIKEDYPAEWEGALIGKDAAELARVPEGKRFGNGIPGMVEIIEQKVINVPKNECIYVQFRPEIITEVAKKIKLAQKTKQNDMFLFKTDDLDTGEVIHFVASIFLRFYEGCKHLGLEGFYWSKWNEPAFAMRVDEVCLVMPFAFQGEPSENYTIVDL